MKDKWILIPSYNWKEMHIYWTGVLLGDKRGVETHAGRTMFFVLIHHTLLVPGRQNK